MRRRYTGSRSMSGLHPYAGKYPTMFVGYLKGKSALMIFDRHANLKYKYGNRNFWFRGYYADTVGKNEKAI